MKKRDWIYLLSFVAACIFFYRYIKSRFDSMEKLLNERLKQNQLEETALYSETETAELNKENKEKVSPIKTLIADGKLAEAIEKMQEICSQKKQKFMDDVVHLSSRFKEYWEKNQKGIITRAEARVEWNQLTAVAIELSIKIAK